MSCALVTIRPEPGCSQTAARGRAFGLEIGCHPMFAVVPCAWFRPEGRFDGLLAGSANAFRHGGPGLSALMALPVYAVGEATAAAAWDRGFKTAAIGSGGLQAVLDSLAGQRLRLLRLGGAERVPLAPPDGVELVDVVAYRTEPLAMDAVLADELDRGAVVLLHSAAAARHFAAECGRLELHRERIRIAALGPRIAEAAGGGWADVRSAAEPSEEALLALARELCHDPFVG